MLRAVLRANGCTVWMCGCVWVCQATERRKQRAQRSKQRTQEFKHAWGKVVQDAAVAWERESRSLTPAYVVHGVVGL